MKRFLGTLSSLLFSLVPLLAAEKPEPTPLPRAHSHNDYEQRLPLLDALDHGFGSVEADIHLVEGRLLVAHDLKNTRPDKTLQGLYLDPLRERVKSNGGRVYLKGPTIWLLIDVKSDAEKTYAVLRDVLKSYQDILTVFQPGTTETRALTVVISGNRPRKMMAEETMRYAAYDGRLEDLDATEPAPFIAWISDNWTTHFTWRGTGPFPDAEKQKLTQIVEKAHQQGRQVRFWATPHREALWQALFNAGVDLLNADDLPGMQKFLLNQNATK